jgi:hypothetical protein
MSPIRFTIASMALAALCATGANAAPAPKSNDAIAKLAAAAKPMSAQALDAIYSGKSWKWKDGGGYFASDKSFAGWQQTGPAWYYYGRGRWTTSNSGKLCMQALWYFRTGYDKNPSCILHREKDGVIYQKPALGGEWYVFRHNPKRPDDEINRLTRGDRVSQHLTRLQAMR